MSKAFQAHAKGTTFTAATPRAAAVGFFERYPDRRKCNVIEGTVDGPFFSIRYGRKSAGEWPQSWSDVTKKTAPTLPDTQHAENVSSEKVSQVPASGITGNAAELPA
jgi:hypothetical protein